MPLRCRQTQGHVITHQALETEIGERAEGTPKRVVFTSMPFTNLYYSNTKLDRYIEHCLEFVAWMKKDAASFTTSYRQD